MMNLGCFIYIVFWLKICENEKTLFDSVFVYKTIN